MPLVKLLEGRHVWGLDQTGLSQKGGPVMSDLRISLSPLETAKISTGGADLYLGFDLLVAARPDNLAKCDRTRTVAVVSTSQIPTGEMITNISARFPQLADTRAVIDHAITSTMSRTIITHGSTQMMVLAMLIFGGETLYYFSLALTIGILFGIYSSVLVASPLVMWLGVSREQFIKPKKVVEGANEDSV